MQRAGKPRLSVKVFYDYICPFCYVGSARLMRLREDFDLQVSWCSFEIHPDTPPEGLPISKLGYAPAQWQRMMENLGKMVREEGLDFADRTFTTNSHKALLLAEASKEEGDEIFYVLHDRLFKAYFSEQQNIGDTKVLKALANQVGLSAKTVERAWNDPRYEEILRKDLNCASQMGINCVPTFIIGNNTIEGAVPAAVLLDAARENRENARLQ